MSIQYSNRNNWDIFIGGNSINSKNERKFFIYCSNVWQGYNPKLLSLSELENLYRLFKPQTFGLYKNASGWCA